VFLGVDGGGTKTALVLVDSNGNIVARQRQDSAYHLQTGIEELRRQIKRGVESILADAGIEAANIQKAFFGLPAYGEDSRIVAELDEIPASLFERPQYQCGNDMVCAWAGSLGGSDGINIVAGTGSIAYGERQGRSARAGGWGELFSDEGSAYWLAVRGLRLFSQMSDGRLPRGPLYDVVRDEFHLTQDLDLSGFVMVEIAGKRDAMAALARLVAKAAELADAAVLELYVKAAKELVRIVAAVARQLGYNEDEVIATSYSGGVFRAGAIILDPLRAELRDHELSYRLVAPLYEPDIGAAIYAGRLAGIGLEPKQASV
jgi:N-acetylglucosamine kinase-like BadF-type ATPase